MITPTCLTKIGEKRISREKKVKKIKKERNVDTDEQAKDWVYKLQGEVILPRHWQHLDKVIQR